MFKLQTILMCCVVAAYADYEDDLKKLWIGKDSDVVINAKSDSIVTHSSNYKAHSGNPKLPHRTYSFKPRAIPLRREAERSQVERNYYADDIKNKSELLFPGNYAQITKESREKQLNEGFYPKAIPLLRNEDFQGRSLDVQDEPVIKKPESFTEAASRRSLSDIFGEDDDDDDELDDDDGEYEVEDPGNGELERSKYNKKKLKSKKLKQKKLKKYMLPLLLAYKMKYFALVPVMIAGLVLLIGATGLAGFFFALFAAVMGLQKGSY